MIIGSVCENKATEKRISVTPDNVKKFVSNGFKVYLEKNYGDHLDIDDQKFLENGAEFFSDKEKIINAAKIANAHNFIQKLPSKYETKISERGTNLSGGQIQRIAIARAILGNPSILLLDEATSALDAESESEVQKGLNQAMRNRTVIIIAHRLSTVKKCECIYEFENGSIKESGDFDYLLNNSNTFKEMTNPKSKDFNLI